MKLLNRLDNTIASIETAQKLLDKLTDIDGEWYEGYPEDEATWDVIIKLEKILTCRKDLIALRKRISNFIKD